MDKFSDEVVERFWGQVDGRDVPDSCWNWIGPVRPDGYGVFNLGMRLELAHRLALEISKGDIPVGLVVLNTCGNRLCCNPAHLQVATPAERMAARRSRLRRVPRPEDPPQPDGG